MSKPDEAQHRFAQRVAEVLAGRDSAVVAAAELADFPWERLCFERDDELQLKFSGGEEKETVFRFRYEDFFVAEPYVEKSPAEQCIGRNDRLLVKKKYPGYNDTVEFQLADGAAPG